MPFDATPTQPIDRLIDALRGPQKHAWYFGNCQTCAIETAHLTLGTPHIETNRASESAEFAELARQLQMPFDAAVEIFLPLALQWEYLAVQPHHVAASLEHYKLTREALSPFHFVQ